MLLKKKPISISDADSIIAEQFRNIRTHLHFISAEHKIRSLLITSPGPRDGKTMTAVHLAAALAQQGQRVLLVDTNLRNPNLERILKANSRVGLSNLLNGENTLEQAVQPSKFENVFLITSGTIPFNPAELLGSDQMKKFMVIASADFDVILFDSPAVMEVADSRILASLCDGVLLVLRSGKTKEKAVQETKRLLQLTSANVLGVILTDTH